MAETVLTVEVYKQAEAAYDSRAMRDEDTQLADRDCLCDALVIAMLAERERILGVFAELATRWARAGFDPASAVLDAYIRDIRDGKK